jgi:hypothetical protein
LKIAFLVSGRAALSLRAAGGGEIFFFSPWGSKVLCFAHSRGRPGGRSSLLPVCCLAASLSRPVGRGSTIENCGSRHLPTSFFGRRVTPTSPAHRARGGSYKRSLGRSVALFETSRQHQHCISFISKRKNIKILGRWLASDRGEP